MRLLPIVAGLGGLLAVTAPAQAVTCTTSSAGAVTPELIVDVDLAAGDTATVTTSRGLGEVVFLDVSGCLSIDAATVRRVDVTGTGGAEALVYAPSLATPLPASAFTEPWQVDLGAGARDAIELRTAGAATTMTAGADGIALDVDGDRELAAPLGVELVRLLGSVEADVLSGAGGEGTGAATLLPLLLVGGEGADTLAPGLGPDEIFGGDGFDRVTYAGRAAGVSSDPDGLADDGAPGEGDRVGTDVEGAVGGEGPDVLASAASIGGAVGVVLVLEGNGGADRLQLGSAASVFGLAPRAEGGAGADELRGGAGADVLDGGPDADVLRGGDGPDVLDGGPGGDVLDGGPGRDDVSYEVRAAPVTVDLRTPGGDGQAGEGDSILAVEVITGTPFADRLTAGSEPQTFRAGAGADVLVGGTAADELDGGEGPDAIDAGAGGDAVFPGSGDDVVVLGPGDDIVFGISGPDGADRIAGGPGLDEMAGYAGRSGPVRVVLDGLANDGEPGEGDRIAPDVEHLLGTAHDDLLVGAAGDQILEPGSGSDEVRGGPGHDEYRWSTREFFRTLAVTVTLDGRRNDGAAGELDLVGPDVEDVDASSAASSVLVGDGRSNRLVGSSSGDDVLTGGGGDDELRPLAGTARVDGGAGRDALDLDFPSQDPGVTVDLGRGTFSAGDRGAVLRGTVRGVEEARGGALDDVLVGSARADSLLGRGGDDVLDGRGGGDELDGGEGRDRVLGGAGADALDGGTGPDDLRGGGGADSVAGGLGPDRLVGDAGPDTLAGGGGPDALVARGGGVDVVDGGPGRDRATLDRADVRRGIEQVVRRLAALVRP